MCLGIPARIIKLKGLTADLDIGGIVREANVQLVPDLKVGDYVLLHAGFAIQLIDEEEALETLRILEEMGEIR